MSPLIYFLNNILAVLSICAVYPYSLSYHPTTFTNLLLIDVDNPSTKAPYFLPMMSLETIGSYVMPSVSF